MKTKSLLFSLFIAYFAIISAANAQKFTTKTGTIRFFSEAPAENIEALNRQVNSALDVSTGDFVFKVLMKGFQFEKALMQEHFNENYVESNKYPSATFIGKIISSNLSDLNKIGTYEVEVSGDLTIRGKTQKITEKGSFEVKAGAIAGKSKFYIKLADFDIKIPKTVVKNISETIEITVDVNLEALAK